MRVTLLCLKETMRLDILDRNIDCVARLRTRRGQLAMQVEVTLFLLLSWKH
jgi:hypothetical protein